MHLLPPFTGAPEPGNVYNVDALTLLRAMPAGSVQTCVTSPPYYGLRDYGVGGQIGLEDTPAAYVARLVAVFDEVRRVLRDDGTLWLNLGDSYNGTGGGHTKAAMGKSSFDVGDYPVNGKSVAGLPPKNLLGIPWRVAFALQDAGWILRSDIIWAKGNPMPESVTDRPTKAHEYVFLLAKSARYYYDADAVAEPVAEATIGRMQRGVSDNHKNVNGAPGQTPHSMNKPRPHINKQDALGKRTYTGFNNRYFNQTDTQSTRNKRTVWHVNTQPFSGAHFAVFPPKLIEPCILAGAPPGGVVLDPFMGSGTTALVARQYNRQYIGSELSPEYAAIARKRLATPYTPNMFETA